jgi:hypothetical protein
MTAYSSPEAAVRDDFQGVRENCRVRIKSAAREGLSRLS